MLLFGVPLYRGSTVLHTIMKGVKTTLHYTSFAVYHLAVTRLEILGY